MARIFVVGALVYDIVFDVPDWVAPNQAVHASQVTLSPGGKALNQATAARRVGADDVRLIGCVGDDIFGADMLAALRREGVNIEQVRQLAGNSTSIAGIVVKDGMPGFIGAPDASRQVDEEHLREALKDLRADDILLIDFEIPQQRVRYALQLGREAGATTVLNPAPFFTRDAFVIDYLHLVDVLIPNKAEAQLILEGAPEDLDALACGLLQLGIGTVVLTLGEEGSIHYRDDCRVAQPGFKVAAVDTTGASDAFVGAYCCGLARAWPARKTLAFASATAGLACTRRGTMSALPFLADVQALMAQPAADQ
ncbi:MAG: ribokinase [Chloroflexota bacterium]|nr:ribokinase [Chloroflexota bacterium]MDE2948498.1 ribokinase [Chloroflexota bacterium]